MLGSGSETRKYVSTYRVTVWYFDYHRIFPIIFNLINSYVYSAKPIVMNVLLKYFALIFWAKNQENMSNFSIKSSPSAQWCISVTKWSYPVTHTVWVTATIDNIPHYGYETSHVSLKFLLEPVVPS